MKNLRQAIVDEKTRKRFLIITFNFSALFSFVFFGSYFFIKKEYFKIILLSLFFIPTLVNILLFFKKNYINFASNFTVILFFVFELILYIFLPTNGYVLFWLYIFPPVAVLLVGEKKGRYFSLALLLFVILIYIFGRQFLTPEFQLSYNYEQLLRVVITYMVLTFMLFVFEISRKALQNEINEKFVEIVEQNEEIKSAEEELRQTNEELYSTNERLKEREEWLHKLLQNLGDGLIIIDKLGNFTFVNNAAAQMYGLPPEKLVGLNFSTFFSDKNLEIIYQAIKQAEAGKTSKLEVTAHNIDGQQLTLLTTMYPEYNNFKEIKGYIAIFKDITEIKKYQKQTELQLKQLRILLESLPAFVFFKDKDLRYVQINTSYAILLNKTADELIGKRYSDIFDDENAKKFEELDRKILETGIGIYQQEAIHTDENGQIFWVSVSKVPYYKEGKEPAGIVGIIQDITEKKQKEQEILSLNSELRKYFAAIKHSPVGILITNAEGYIEYINGKFTELTGFTLESLKKITERLLKTQKVPEGILELIFSTIKRKTTLSKKIQFYHRKTKETRFFDMSITPVFNDEKEITNFVGIFSDVTDLENERLEVEKLNEKLKKYFIAIEQSPVGIAFLTKNGYRTYVNKSYLSITGYTKQYALTEQSGIFKNKDVIEEIKKGEILKTEYIRKKDKNYYEQVYLFPIKDTKKNILDYVLLIDDITLQKEQEQIIREQRDTLKKINEDIQESINYAKYIQKSLMQESDLIKKFFEDSFVLYKPKEIISGDFYYVKKINNYLIFAVADCTGHGIPGAFISVLGYSMLNEIVFYRDVESPATVLNILRSRIKRFFKNLQIGMDIALCALNLETKKLQFAGAYNPLYLVRDGVLIEYKATRNPIGAYPIEKDFDNIEFKLQKNDIIYLFSDGYADQFGIDQEGKQRKFTKKAFKELLITISHKPMTTQFNILEQSLKQWRQGIQQTDDITIMGLKVP